MSTFLDKYGFTEDEWESCLKVLDQLKNKPLENPNNLLFKTLITKISKNAKKILTNKEAHKRSANETINNTLIVQNAHSKRTFYGEESDNINTSSTTIKTPKNCYSCNRSFVEIHSFYHRLCPSCAKINFANRTLKVDLTNRNVILTGGRVKVGYATALKFLRCNANLTITTRFPAIALNSFKKEKDYASWKDNLTIYQLDLRIIKDIETFINYYNEKNNSLDILINNAAQTIQYDNNYYKKIKDFEKKLILNNNKNALLEFPKLMHQSNDKLKLLEEKDLNRFGQPIDKRVKNSWNSKLDEINVLELLEVNLINQIAPYILIKGFTPTLKNSPFKDKFIINVTSSEGQFSYKNKTPYHPHTNMTKAALNMLTYTSAKDYIKDNIYLNCVDVGWISTGAIESLRSKQFSINYIPPLDPVDGASRILHPIREKIENNNSIFGKLIKNYKIEDW